ncbi:uncharacterized protein PG986_006425 [Apiospora aurea]|uniref:Uncharacterized protein n=1 Tax=Apiospora aurea TaxID=335848 RepID=A0ABR1QKE2_9PEZI
MRKQRQSIALTFEHCRYYPGPSLPRPIGLAAIGRPPWNLERIYLLVDVYDWAPEGKLSGPWWDPINKLWTKIPKARDRDSVYYEVDISLARDLHLQDVVELKEGWDRLMEVFYVCQYEMRIQMNI